MRLLFLLVIHVFLAAWGLGQSPPTELYVFLPSEIRPHAMRQALSKAFPDLNVTVFPRFRDFRDRLQEAPPDAFLSLQPIAEALNHGGALKGARDGETEEVYALLSEKAIDAEKIGELNIGVVDLLGRKAMSTFVQRKLGGVNPKVKPVTKLEDLLSMLQFSYVDAIFVPKSKIGYYKKKTELNLTVTELGQVTVGLPVVVIINQERAQLVKRSFSQLKPDLNSKLGVDQWVVD